MPSIDDYGVTDSECLPVCEAKVFALKDYYNYLLDEEV